MLVGLLLCVMLCLNFGNNVFSQDYEVQIREVLQKKIEEKKKDCLSSWSAEKCEAMSRVYVEASVFADILDSKWELIDASLVDGYVYVTVKRGKDIPLIGKVNVGKFDYVEFVYLDKGKVVVVYKDLTKIDFNVKSKLFLAGFGLGSVSFLLGVLLIILL